MLRAEVEALRVENCKFVETNDELLGDEIARMKKLPPRPSIKPSGMEKAIEQGNSGRSSHKRRGRDAKHDRDRLNREVVVKPSGSRFKGYETCLVRDIVLEAELVRYPRERWVTPDGKTIIVPMPDGL